MAHDSFHHFRMLSMYGKQYTRTNLSYHIPDFVASSVPRCVGLNKTHAEMLEPIVQSLVIYQHLFVKRLTKGMHERASVLRFDVDELPHAIETQMCNQLRLVLPQLLCSPSVLER